MVMVACDVTGLTVPDVSGLLTKHVPYGRPLSILMCCAFYLIRACRCAPYKSFWQSHFSLFPKPVCVAPAPRNTTNLFIVTLLEERLFTTFCCRDQSQCNLIISLKSTLQRNASSTQGKADIGHKCGGYLHAFVMKGRTFSKPSVFLFPNQKTKQEGLACEVLDIPIRGS